jgi:hypothetical protein
MPPLDMHHWQLLTCSFTKMLPEQLVLMLVTMASSCRQGQHAVCWRKSMRNFGSSTAHTLGTFCGLPTCGADAVTILMVGCKEGFVSARERYTKLCATAGNRSA